MSRYQLDGLEPCQRGYMPCFFALSCRHAISKTRTNQYNLLHYICEEVLRSQYTEEDISQANCMHKSLITQQQNTNSIHNAKTFRLSSISIKRHVSKAQNQRVRSLHGQPYFVLTYSKAFPSFSKDDLRWLLYSRYAK